MFSVPLLFRSLFQLLYSTVDTAIVGKYVGNLALSAVGATNPATFLFTSVFWGLSAAGTVLVAQHFGAGQERMMQRDTANLFSLGTIGGIAMMGLGEGITMPILKLLNVPEEILELSSLYLRIYLFGVPAVALFSIGGGILQAVGNSTLPVYISFGSSVLNILLDLLFVRRFHWSIAGAAAATVISQYTSAALVLYVFQTAKGPIHFNLRKLSCDRSTMLQILRIGIPQALERCITSFGVLLTQSYINVFGTALIAGYVIYNRLDTFVFMVGSSISTAVMTFTGQNYGAGRRDRLQKGKPVATAIAMGAQLVIIATILLFRLPIISLFVDLNANGYEDIIHAAEWCLLTVLPFCLCYGYYLPRIGMTKGLGDVIATTLIQVGSFVGIKQLYLYIATHFVANTPLIVIMGSPLAWMTCSIAITLRLRHLELRNKQS